ncbi:DUF3144 domain-containing protein [Pseudoduganella violacea]|uniref:DUF3144 domain-containing protein n=1 Tax=Pseudoduganella violacea TaxID=1715466 RepID=A0A7W5B7Z6_9BURK|nr:DUF3144 domain-containing protein [Pseudoduganella violacea]MBB3117880.1 hypothetical protein [Pseudoduganella violacea]
MTDKPSAEQQTEDQQFWKFIDAHILLANEQLQNDPARANIVGAAMLFAAARFNSYLLAAGSGTREVFAGRKEEAGHYLREQFNKMLSDNLDDFDTNFEQHQKGN